MKNTHNMNSNSVEALVKAMASIPECRMAVLHEIGCNQGSTANELVASFLKRGLDYPINRITPRILELRQQGLVKVAKSRKDKYTGFTAMTYITTAKANAMADAWLKCQKKGRK